MARPVTFPITGSAAQNAAQYNAMQDGLRSNRVVYGSQGTPVTGAPYAATADFVPGTAQLYGLTIELYAGSDAALVLETDSVAAGEESWITLVYRQVGGPWVLTFIHNPFAAWSILTEGNAAINASTSANAVDIFDLWTPNGTDWFGAVTKAWS